VYDPVPGRILSPDPIVQIPTFVQSWNRYSYLNNTPTSFTDLTGYYGNETMEEIVVTGSRGSTLGSRHSMLHTMGSFSVSNGGGFGGGGGGVGASNFSRAGAGATAATEAELSESAESEDLGYDEIIVTEKGSPITGKQPSLARNGQYLAFWRSRYLGDGDPVSRTALIGWGDSDFVGASLIERLAADYTWAKLEEYISKNNLPVTMQRIAAELALAHAVTVMNDRRGISNLLSLTEIAEYHHTVCGKHSIPPHLFGGTLAIPYLAGRSGGLGFLVADPKTYSNLWCNGCDSTP